MSKSPFARWRESLSNYGKSGKQNRRPLRRRDMSFETLERRELMAVTALSDFSVNEDTGEKPQSKVWEYNDTWYSVMPDSSGTWVWKLNGTQWQKQLQLTADDGFQADVKVSGNLAHVLLFDGSNSKLATVEYDHGVDNRYEMWSLRPSLVNVAVNDSAETAVIDIDSTGRMWVAYDTSSTMEVRYADFGAQFTNWSAPITVALGHQVRRHRLADCHAERRDRRHVVESKHASDLASAFTSTAPRPVHGSIAEVPANQSAQSKGAGMADDHIHLAVASDGTLYAAVKTSYDSSGYPRMCLLVRRPSGVWDNMYTVDTRRHSADRDDQRSGRQADRRLHAVRQRRRHLLQRISAAEHFFRCTPDVDLRLGEQRLQREGLVHRRSRGDRRQWQQGQGLGLPLQWTSRSTAAAQNQAPNVNAGVDRTIQLPNSVSLDATVTDDGQPAGTLTTSWTMVSGPGSVSFANASAVDTTASFSAAGTYVLRLTANDGSLQSNDTVTIVVQAPVNNPPPPTNTPPTVNAGSNQTIQLPNSANLSAIVTDSGGPLATPTISWTRVSGPGTVTFSNAASANTSASFSVAGTYVLRITANDGQYQTSADITIIVQAAPVTPPPTTDPPKTRLKGKGR